MLEKAVTSLIDLSFDNRKKIDHSVMSVVQYAKEQCTISLGVPRQSGKTRFIIDHVEFDDAIVAYNNAAAVFYKSKRNLNCEIFTLTNLATLGSARARRRYHRIYLDEITNTKDYVGLEINKTIDLIYKFFAIDERQTFIFLYT